MPEHIDCRQWKHRTAHILPRCRTSTPLYSTVILKVQIQIKGSIVLFTKAEHCDSFLVSAETAVGKCNILKGIVHRKIEMHSLSTQHYADGKVGEVFESTKHFWSLRGKLCINTIEVTSDSFFRRNKTTEKQHNMPPYCLCCVIQVTRSPVIYASGWSDANAHPVCALGRELVCSVCLFSVCAFEFYDSTALPDNSVLFCSTFACYSLGTLVLLFVSY